MDWLNYQHLYYFWVVAREGTIRGASEELRLAPSTISVQIRQLSEQMGHDIFQRTGRRLVLTEMGRAVFRYADAIFTTGRELLDFVNGRRPGYPLRLDVGVAGVVPKLLAHKFIEPALQMESPVHLVVHSDRQDRLLTDLALHHLDVIITDAPVGPEARVRVFTHSLGSCGVTFFATSKLHAQIGRDFPNCLDGAPFLLPTSETALRRVLDHWFDSRELHPVVVGEYDDSGLLKAFGQHGYGVFVAPDIIAEEIARQYRVEPIGRADSVQERFYAVSIERQLKHPAVAHIKQSAAALLQ